MGIEGGSSSYLDDLAMAQEQAGGSLLPSPEVDSESSLRDIPHQFLPALRPARPAETRGQPQLPAQSVSAMGTPIRPEWSPSVAVRTTEEVNMPRQEEGDEDRAASHDQPR